MVVGGFARIKRSSRLDVWQNTVLTRPPKPTGRAAEELCERAVGVEDLNSGAGPRINIARKLLSLKSQREFSASALTRNAGLTHHLHPRDRLGLGDSNVIYRRLPTLLLRGLLATEVSKRNFRQVVPHNAPARSTCLNGVANALVQICLCGRGGNPPPSLDRPPRSGASETQLKNMSGSKSIVNLLLSIDGGTSTCPVRSTLFRRRRLGDALQDEAFRL
jgi:hypothetical protein